MIDIPLFIFGLFVSGCVTAFVVLTRSEFKKMNAHPELYQRPLRDYFSPDEVENTSKDAKGDA
jgi:hypothetical protein